MSRDEVLAGFAEVLCAVAGLEPADVTPEASLAGLGLDSLMMVEVVVAAEDRFGVLIDDDEWARFETVRDATRYIERATAGPA